MAQCYENNLGEVGGEKAHRLLHTHYHHRRRIDEKEISLIEPVGTETGPRLEVKVCVGTSCFVKGSQELLNRLTTYVETTWFVRSRGCSGDILL